MRYTISDTDLHIVDSYKVSERGKMHSFLMNTRRRHPQSQVWTRSMDSLINEWRGHNFLYVLHIERDRTADVDLDVPTKWYTEVAYAIMSFLYNFIH